MNREICALKGFLLVFYNKTTQRTTERENLSNIIKHNKDYHGGRQRPHMKQVWPIWNMTHHDLGELHRQAKYFQGNVFGGMFGISLTDLLGSSSFAATINWSVQR